MACITVEMSDDDRAKRAAFAALSMEQMNLLQNLACERDRERLRTVAESDPERFALSDSDMSAINVPAFIQAGDRFARERRYNDALAEYRHEVAACKVDMTADRSDAAAQIEYSPCRSTHWTGCRFSLCW